MGVIQQPIIAPVDGRTLDNDAFRTLAVAIARGALDEYDEYDEYERWVKPPFAIYRGQNACSFFLWSRNDQPSVWEGNDADELDDALAEHLDTNEDICVWFAGVVEKSDAFPGGGQCPLALRRTVAPVEHKESNSYLEEGQSYDAPSAKARVWLEGEGKGAPLADDIVDGPIGALLKEAFGTELFVITSAH